MGGTERPTAEEVIDKLRDDGDFDTLRLSIIRKVKENEELRNSIIGEVKQSVILNADGSEDLKPRQLSDGIYQEVGSKIMGRISDEIWKVIKSDDSKSQIRETVESVYNRLINHKEKNEDRSSPNKQQPASSNSAHASPVYPKGRNEVRSSPYNQHPANCSSANASPAAASTTDVDTLDGIEPMGPPGFAPSDQHTNSSNKEENKEMLLDERPSSSSREVNHRPPDGHRRNDEELPPGFAPHHGAPEQPGGGSDEDPDVPPGFG